jgi:hypothetical protein
VYYTPKCNLKRVPDRHLRHLFRPSNFFYCEAFLKNLKYYIWFLSYYIIIEVKTFLFPWGRVVLESDSRPANQETPHLLWNPEKEGSFTCLQEPDNLSHKLMPYFFNLKLSIIIPASPRSPKLSFLQIFSTVVSYFSCLQCVLHAPFMA